MNSRTLHVDYYKLLIQILIPFWLENFKIDPTPNELLVDQLYFKAV